MTSAARLTVVVPVYDGLDDLRRCLESVRRHRDGLTTEFDLLLVDDAGPDPRVAALLDEFVADEPATTRLLRHERNRGFVASVNEGFAATGGDVVLLNADTVVTAGWLDQMVAASREPDVATVTPLTNHGSICTIPRSVIDAFSLDGDEPRIDDCGRFVHEQTLALRPDVITGVGFCLLLSRTALDLVGPFDEVAYGRGYGEEVDFCVRAARLGLRHVVDDTTFVYHRGGVSFADERDDRMHAASTFLRKRFRFFNAANRRERADDPLLLGFTALELGLRPRRMERPHVLHLLHGPPDAMGGTEKHLGSLLSSLLDEVDSTMLYPVESGFVLRTRWAGDGGRPIEHELLLPGSVRWVAGIDDPVAGEALRMALDLFPADAIHIHSLNGFSLAPLTILADFDGPVIAFAHDPFLACPHYSLLYRNTVACGIPDDLAVCARCLPETEGLEVAALERFRAVVTDHLDTVDRWVFASRAAADLFVRAYAVGDDRIEIIEHGPPIDPTGRPPLDDHLVLDEPLRLAFVGRGWTKKGLGAANRLADDLSGTTVEIHHFGDLVEPASPNLILHGPYDNEILPDLLARTGIQIVLLPGPTPESYGLVMSEALIAGRPIIGAHYGALGERIRANGVGWTIDPTDPDALRTLVERLDRHRPEILRAAGRTATVTAPSPAEIAARYAALYRGDPPHHEDQP